MKRAAAAIAALVVLSGVNAPARVVNQPKQGPRDPPFDPLGHGLAILALKVAPRERTDRHSADESE